MAEDGNPQQQLEWEARQRPRAAIAAAIAAPLLFVGEVGAQLVLQKAPNGRLLDTLGAVQAPGPVDGRTSALVGRAQYIVDHSTGLLLPAIATAIGYVALAYLLTFLAAATRVRRRQMPRVALYLPAFGAVLLGLATVASTIGLVSDQQGFLDGPHTVAAAHDAAYGGLRLVATILVLPAELALAAAYMLVCINAMRAGLLTRFMGVLGAIVGALVIIPIGPIPVVQSVWMIGIALLLVGRRPGGDPPAWRTGREEPWPSMADQQAAARAAKGDREGTAQPQREPVAVAAGRHPATAKRKRKRRR